MYGNGVRTGMETTVAVRRPILQDQHLALAACAVAAVGTTPAARITAGYRIVATTVRAAVTTISGCAFLYLSINT